MLEIWGMWSTPSLPSLLGSLGSGMVAPDRVLTVGQIELNCVFMQNRIVWNGTVFETVLEIELFLPLKLSTYAKLNCFK